MAQWSKALHGSASCATLGQFIRSPKYLCWLGETLRTEEASYIVLIFTQKSRSKMYLLSTNFLLLGALWIRPQCPVWILIKGILFPFLKVALSRTNHLLWLDWCKEASHCLCFRLLKCQMVSYFKEGCILRVFSNRALAYYLILYPYKSNSSILSMYEMATIED